MSARGVSGRVVLAAALLAFAGCASAGHLPARPAPALLPAGSPLGDRSLPDTEAWLRHHVFLGEAESALDMLRPRGRRYATGDRLILDLQGGIVQHLAGRYEESNAFLHRAELEVERRFTRSVVRAAGSLVASDHTLAYVPTFTERASIAYYRMLNFLALGDGEGAAVEARRLNAFLLRHEDETGVRCGVNGFFQYLTSFAYAAQDAWNDATVSLRQAQRAFAECGAGPGPVALQGELARAAARAGMPDLASEADLSGALLPMGPLPEHGRLLLVVEGGFAPAKIPRTLHVPIFPEEIEGLESSQAGEVLAAAAGVAARLVSSLVDPARPWSYHDDDPLHLWGRSLEGAHLVRLTWTDFAPPGPSAAVRVVVGGEEVEVAMAEPFAQHLLEEFRAQRAAVITRTVVRALSSYLLTREAEQRSERAGGRAAGVLAGFLANLTLNALEEADTRSWSLLPERIGVIHLELPAGEHTVSVKSAAAEGLREVGTVRVRAGRTAVLSTRLWTGGADAVPSGELAGS
jgi:uncharacterized protein